MNPILITGVGGLGLVALGYVRWQIPAGVLVGVILSTLLLGAHRRAGSARG